MELLLVILLVILLVGGLGGPRLGWWGGVGIVSLLIWVLFLALLIWLVAALVGSGFSAGGGG